MYRRRRGSSSAFGVEGACSVAPMYLCKLVSLRMQPGESRSDCLGGVSLCRGLAAYNHDNDVECQYFGESISPSSAALLSRRRALWHASASRPSQ